MEENFIDFIDVILPFDDEVLYDDIKFPARREGIARLCKEVFGLVKVKLKSNGKRKDGRFLGCIALPRSYFGEMAAVNVCFLVHFCICHALIVNQAEKRFIEWLIQMMHPRESNAHAPRQI